MKQLLGFLLLVGIVLTYWYIFVALMFLALVVLLGPAAVAKYQQDRYMRRATWEALAARAVQQDQWYLAGDPRGIYG